MRRILFVAAFVTSLFFGELLIGQSPQVVYVKPLGIQRGETTPVGIYGKHLEDAHRFWTNFASDTNLFTEAPDLSKFVSLLAGQDGVPEHAIVMEAEAYETGNFARDRGWILNGYQYPNVATYHFEVSETQNYQFEIAYASGQERPVELAINGQLFRSDGAKEPSGGFARSDVRWFVQGVVTLPSGSNTLQFKCPGATPHIAKIAFIPTVAETTFFPPAPLGPTQASLALTVPESVHSGRYVARLTTRRGVSRPVLLMVDDLGSVTSQGAHDLATAQYLELPTAVEGNCQPQDWDYFRFSATKGQQIEIEVVARRLDSNLDPVMQVFSSEMTELLFEDDSPGLSGDCQAKLVCPASGEYILRLRDVAYQGGEAHRYRLRIGKFTLLDRCDRPSGEGAAESHLSELEPNNERAMATTVKVGAVIHGQLVSASDRDWYRFHVQQGQKLRLTDQMRSAAAAADVYFEIFDTAGKRLATAAESGNGVGVLRIVAPSDGDLWLMVEGLVREGGGAQEYRIANEIDGPRFGLTLENESTTAAERGYCVLQVTCTREGFDEPVELAAQLEGETLKVGRNIIPAGTSTTNLKIYLPPTATRGDLLRIEILGQSQVGDAQFKARASTLAAVRKVLPNVTHPPAALAAVINVGVGPELPDFFQLTLQGETVLFPQIIGVVEFPVFVVERAQGFSDAIEVRVEGLPDGFNVTGGDMPVGNSKNSEYKLTLSGPADTELTEAEITLVGEGSFQGQTKEIELAHVPLRVVPPLVVQFEVHDKPAAGADVQLTVKANRFTTRNGGGRQQVKLSWREFPTGITGAKDFVIEAGRDEATLTLTLSATANPADLEKMIAVARTTVREQEIEVLSQPFSVKP